MSADRPFLLLSYFFSLLFIQTDYPYYCLISLPTFGRELQYPSLVFLLLLYTQSYTSEFSTVYMHSPPLAACFVV